MRTVLIAQRDIQFAGQLAARLRAWGCRVIECPGALPPEARCIRCDKGYCPLSEGADVMIYDPSLTAISEAGEVHNLSIDSALAHADVPMLLAWPPETVPDVGTLRAIRSAASSVQVAAQSPIMLRTQLQELVEGVAFEVE